MGLDAACPSEMMAMPKAIAITNGAACAKNKTVKAAAAAAMALALSGGIAAAATGNLPGQSEARHRRVSDHIEPSATTGNLPGPAAG